MTRTEKFKTLSERLSSGNLLITDLTNQEHYFGDATYEQSTPDVIVMAETENDIIETINFCREKKIPITARGAGTGLSGGCIPVNGGILLSTENIKHIDINTKSKTAVCGPGAITKDLLDQAEKLNLTYPPDPASFAESTLGGNVAENAGGLRCLKYGVTKDYVIGIRAVTLSGKILNTGSCNNYQGFNLNDVTIGSEGTLSIISELTLRLIDKPLIGNTFLITFDSPSNAAQTIADIRSSSITPTVMEYLDGDAAQCSNKYEKLDGLNDKVEALLLIETSGNDEDKENETKLISELASKNNATEIRLESDKAKTDELWRVRRNLSKAVKAISMYRISEDVAVPISKFPELVSYVYEMNQRYAIRINSFGHAGDGNLHVNFLSSDKSPGEMKAIEQGIDELMNIAIKLGGTLSGEHGIGLEKRKYLPMEFDSPTLSSMKKIKTSFDELDLINPGKIF